MDEKLKEALREELENFKKNLPEYASKEDMTATLDGIENKVNELGVDALKEDINEIRAGVEALNTAFAEKTAKEIQKSLPELIKEKLEAIQDVAKNGTGRVNLTVDKTTLIRSAVTDHTLAQRLGDVGQLASQMNVLRPLFNTGTVGPNSNGTIRYVDQKVNTRNADWKAEAAQKPESAITFQEYSLPIEKIADTIPVSMEMLGDVDFVASEIQNLLLKNLAIKIDNSLWNGDGSTPNIFGIYTKADEYVAAAAGISDANVFDLIVKMQESIATGTMYQPNRAILNFATYNQMVLKKDANENYVRPPFTTSPEGIVNVNGIQIVISNSVAADTMLVGDFSFATLYTLGGLSIDFGFIDKQFVENTITLRAEERMGMLVRTAHTDAFAKETGIAAALVTLAS